MLPQKHTRRASCQRTHICPPLLKLIFIAYKHKWWIIILCILYAVLICIFFLLVRLNIFSLFLLYFLYQVFVYSFCPFSHCFTFFINLHVFFICYRYSVLCVVNVFPQLANQCILSLFIMSLAIVSISLYSLMCHAFPMLFSFYHI